MTTQQQTTGLELSLSNLSCKEEDPITRNYELFKVMLLHKFPGCTVFDYHNNLDCREDEEYYITDFNVIFNILDSSKFEAYIEQACEFLWDNGYIDQHRPLPPDLKLTFALGPFYKLKAMTYCFGFLCKC